MVDGNWWLPWYVDLGIAVGLLPGIIVLAHVLGPVFSGFNDYASGGSYTSYVRGVTAVIGAILAVLWWPMVFVVGLVLTGIWGTFRAFDALEKADERRKNRTREKAAAENHEAELRDEIRRELEAEYQDPLAEINRSLKGARR